VPKGNEIFGKKSIDAETEYIISAKLQKSTIDPII
jgi:hypothetical protein